MLVLLAFFYLNVLEYCLAGPRIVGGRKARIEEFPYQLSLRYNDQHICGAALISKNVALSAAHCFPRNGSYSIRAGSTNLYEGGVVVPLKAAIIHPNHNPDNEDNDIAILLLSRPLKLSSTIKALKLPEQNKEPEPDSYGTVTGWGSVVNIYTQMSETLRSVELPVQHREWCQSRYGYVSLTPRMFCAGFKEGGKDSCQGDSGGPFVINGTLYGIVSWGFNCAVPGYPGIYTNVAMFRDYIRTNCGV